MKVKVIMQMELQIEVREKDYNNDSQEEILKRIESVAHDFPDTFLSHRRNEIVNREVKATLC